MFSQVVENPPEHHENINFGPCIQWFCWYLQQQAVNRVSVLSCCWNLIHMLMSKIPMVFFLLCHRYYPSNSLHPPHTNFLSVFVSFVRSAFIIAPNLFSEELHRVVIAVVNIDSAWNVRFKSRVKDETARWCLQINIYMFKSCVGYFQSQTCCRLWTFLSLDSFISHFRLLVELWSNRHDHLLAVNSLDVTKTQH